MRFRAPAIFILRFLELQFLISYKGFFLHSFTRKIIQINQTFLKMHFLILTPLNHIMRVFENRTKKILMTNAIRKKKCIRFRTENFKCSFKDKNVYGL